MDWANFVRGLEIQWVPQHVWHVQEVLIRYRTLANAPAVEDCTIKGYMLAVLVGHTEIKYKTKIGKQIIDRRKSHYQTLEF